MCNYQHDLCQEKEVQLLIQKKKLCLTHKKSWSTELTDYGKSLTKLMWNPLYRMTYRVGILLTPRATCMWSQTIAPAKLQPHIWNKGTSAIKSNWTIHGETWFYSNWCLYSFPSQEVLNNIKHIIFIYKIIIHERYAVFLLWLSWGDVWQGRANLSAFDAQQHRCVVGVLGYTVSVWENCYSLSVTKVFLGKHFWKHDCVYKLASHWKRKKTYESDSIYSAI